MMKHLNNKAYEDYFNKILSTTDWRKLKDDILNTAEEVVKDGYNIMDDIMSEVMQEKKENKVNNRALYTIMESKDESAVTFILATPGYTKEDISVDFVNGVVKVKGNDITTKISTEYKLIESQLSFNGFVNNFKIVRPVQEINYKVSSGLLQITAKYKTEQETIIKYMD